MPQPHFYDVKHSELGKSSSHLQGKPDQAETQSRIKSSIIALM